MASGLSALRLRVLRGLYGVVQNQPWLKRLAIRMVMRFPNLGARALARVGTPGAASHAGGQAAIDLEATRRYEEGGYRAMLDPCLALPEPVPRRQLFVDISGLIQRDARTGIQRVVRNLTRALAEIDLPGWRVEPVYVHQQHFVYARRFTTADWQLPALALGDEPIRAETGDVFFTADLALLPIAQMEAPLQRLRAGGVAVHFVLHDLIPLTHPQFYQGEVDPRFARWLEIVLAEADGVWCVSAAVLDDLRAYLRRHPPARRDGGPRLGWFHLGANLPAWQATTAQPGHWETLGLSGVTRRSRCFLMVGTLEPRKGHGQVLDAFEALWRVGDDVCLVIIGKVGWNVRPVVDRLRSHPEAGRRLAWFENAADNVLCQAYGTAHALIAASYTEGFGLPLIEAAQHGLPIIARDIPVFREVAGEHAYYFDAADGAALAAAIRAWLALEAEGRAPVSRGLPYLSWAESARRVAQAILPRTE
ncbi:MAG: glycosyltransferase family 4 protein [Pigmentiphaga sp.]|nr:glycosyltransferase family 4 protein [Pigmentiphaga sp.]